MTTYSNFKVAVTPTAPNLGSEGGLDTSLVNGVSIQRSVYTDISTGYTYPYPRVALETNDGSTFSTNVGISGISGYPFLNGAITSVINANPALGKPVNQYSANTLVANVS